MTPQEKIAELREAIKLRENVKNAMGVIQIPMIELNLYLSTAAAAIRLLEKDIPLEQHYDDYDNGVNSGRRAMLREAKEELIKE